MDRLPPVMFLDLDDTILRSSAVANECWERACVMFAPRLENVCETNLIAAINASRRWFWSDPQRHRSGRLNLTAARRQVVQHAFTQLNINSGHIANQLADTFTRTREHLVRPFPGAMDSLRGIRRRGVRTALLTNGSAEFQRQKIQRFGIAPFFDLILIESEFGIGKPDQRVFRHALQFFRAQPKEAWMIGDDLEKDILPAQQMGIPTVWVDHMQVGLPRDTLASPNCRVACLADILLPVADGQS